MADNAPAGRGIGRWLAYGPRAAHVDTRREVVRALAALAVAPLAQAQKPRKHRIAFLGLSSPTDYAAYVDAFRDALRQLGYEEGRNIVIEYRWADGRDERLPGLARELVRLDPDVLVAHAVGVRAAKEATSTIPIVMGVSADPVGFGFIRSLARPGGNITGVASQFTDVAAKRLELLKEAAPHVRRVAVLSNPALPATQKGFDETRIAARKHDVQVTSFGVTAQSGTLASSLAAIVRDRSDGLIVQPDPITGRHGAEISAFALKNRLPTIGGGRQFALDGGLLSFGTNYIDGWRIAAHYVDKILKGAKPADLAVEQPKTFELIVNERTATALGLAIPLSLRLRAELI